MTTARTMEASQNLPTERPAAADFRARITGAGTHELALALLDLTCP